MVIQANVYTFKKAKNILNWEPKNITVKFGDRSISGTAKVTDMECIPGDWAKAEFRLDEFPPETNPLIKTDKEFHITFEGEKIGYGEVIKVSDF